MILWGRMWRKGGVWLCSLLLGCTKSPIESRLTEGSPFPELSLRTLEGRAVTTGQYAGQALLVNVWATWCAPCRKEMPALERVARAHQDAQLRVIGVSIDDDEHVVRELLLQLGVTFPNYLDPGADVAKRALMLTSYPQTFLVGQDGKLLARVEGARQWDSPSMQDWLHARLRASITASAMAKRSVQ